MPLASTLVQLIAGAPSVVPLNVKLELLSRLPVPLHTATRSLTPEPLTPLAAGAAGAHADPFQVRTSLVLGAVADTFDKFAKGLAVLNTLLPPMFIETPAVILSAT